MDLARSSSEKDFIQGPVVPMSGTLAAQPLGVGPPEFPTPMLHRFIGQDNATFRHELFDTPRAQAKTKISRDCPT
jgi:hypothetical protein